MAAAVGDSFAEQFELFAKNAADLKADFQLLASRDELKAALAKICATRKNGSASPATPAN